MAITINSSRDNADDKTVSFTIAYDGKDYKWHGDIPKDADAQTYLDAKSDTLKAEILRKRYFEAVVPQLDGKSALESFEAWVSAGAKNAEVKGTDADGEEIVIKAEETIAKKAWVDSEPPVDQSVLIADLMKKVEALENK
jgi:hypothetical protein